MSDHLSPTDVRRVSAGNDEPGSADSRRNFLKGVIAAGAVGAGSSLGLAASDARARSIPPGDSESARLANASIAELQALMDSGRLTSHRLVQIFLSRINRIDVRGGLNNVLELNPDALAIARDLDMERRTSGPRGPLHGIPFLVKDNYDSADRMGTRAGSLALVGDPPPQDSTAVAKLREAGAVLLGKANLSEWANFRGFDSSSGWCGVAGQGNNPFILDRNPCGSSSGSAASVAAGLCTVALGTETDGSVVCPSSANGVVGIKPTVGLASRAGIVPLADSQDTAGVQGRTVADAAAVLGALTGVDARDPKTEPSEGNVFSDYSPFVDPDGLAGARIGVVRQFDSSATTETLEVFDRAVQVMRDAGAEVIDPVEIPSFDDFFADPAETIVLVFEFKRDLNRYLATRSGVPVANMADVIQFNLDHADEELQFFGQEWFELAEAEIFSEAEYLAALERGPMLAADLGIDAALVENDLDALVAPTGSPAWPTDLITGDCFQFGSSSFAAVAGYPLVTVPGGFVFDLPVGLTFMGTAWSEPTLIRLASGFEAAADVRRLPEFLPTFEDETERPGRGRGRPRPVPARMGPESAARLRQFMTSARVPRPVFL
ncbi:MAG: amidase [Wenzhouxiangellaceae bacterium]|nr:amidase [Wenzhouxiangellaceae bacterium]